MLHWAYDQIGFSPRHHQKIIDDSPSRFTVLVCHRRFGKTVLTVARLLRECMESERDNCRVAYYAPTYNQAKRVAWDYAIQFASRIDGYKVNKLNHWIDFENGSRFMLGSADNPDNSRGIYLDHCAIDEPAHMPTRMWTEVLRPALADREGKCIFLGTPAGRHGMLWDVWNYAEHDEDWTRHMFRASQTRIINDKELKAARNVMSRAEYDQEWECSFSASIKGAYFGDQMADLERAGGIRKDVVYNPARPVHIAMCSGIRQENACWFYQIAYDGYAEFLRYEAFPRKSGPDLVAAWAKLPYKVYGKVIVPKQYNGGNSRADRLRELGMKVLDPEPMIFDDGIEEGRHYIERSRFHVADCKHGIEALRQYRQDWDQKGQAFKKFPVANWSVDPSEAYIYAALCHKQVARTHPQVNYSLMDRAVCRA